MVSDYVLRGVILLYNFKVGIRYGRWIGYGIIYGKLEFNMWFELWRIYE